MHVGLLSVQEKERIHGRALDVLEKVGIKFNSRQALDILEEAGCPVNRDELSAKIPPRLVEQALQTVPHRVLCAALDPRRDLEYGSGKLYCISSSGTPRIRDLETLEMRTSTSQDLVDCATVIDALDEVDEWCPMVVPGDVHPRLRGLRIFELSYNTTRKHLLKSVLPWELPFVLEMMDAILGDRARLKDRPIFSCTYDDIEPLQKDGHFIDGALALSAYRVPIVPYQMVVSGATTPVTLAGSTLSMTANFLSTVVLFQLKQPGLGIIWGGAPTVLDMHAGLAAAEVEAVLMAVAHVEMAKFYGVPCLSLGCFTGAKTMGFQAGMDTVFGTALPALAGADAIYGPASLDTESLTDLPVALLGTEVLRQTRRLVEGMKVDEEHLLFDTIARIGFKADYLGDPSTKRFFRQEHLLPKLYPRESYDTWRARGESEQQMAVAKVKEILRTHRPEPLSPEVRAEQARIMAAAEKALT
jgi:trimethylamine---corrinoid protein Co-methyltransferase